jgi:hypothetical protein
VWLLTALAREAHERALEAALLAPLLTRQVDGDPHQPRTCIRPRAVVVDPPAEGDRESLGGKVGRELLTDPQADEAVQEREVPLEHQPECGGLAEGATDCLGIARLLGGARGLVHYFKLSTLGKAVPVRSSSGPRITNLCSKFGRSRNRFPTSDNLRE